MKQINLLPDPGFLERYKELLVILGQLLCIGASSFALLSYIKAWQPPALSNAHFLEANTSECFRYSIHQLKMVGFLSQEISPTVKRCWSLFMTPAKQIITLQVNDCVGSERAQVVSIQSTGTRFKLPNDTRVVWSKMVTVYE